MSRGAAALAERLQGLAVTNETADIYGASGLPLADRHAADLAAAILGDRGVYLPDGLDAELERLRQQNHEAAERHDREKAKLQSRVGRYESAFARARELVRGSPVDWTNDPPSQEENGWWKYTSQQNRDVIAVAVESARSGSLDALAAKVAALHGFYATSDDTFTSEYIRTSDVLALIAKAAE